MAKCTFRYIEKHQVNRIHSLDFDTSDQAYWTKILTLAEENGLINKNESFPAKAPNDPKLWHEVFQYLPEEELGEVEEDWWMMVNGGFDSVCETLDDKGQVLFED